MLAKPLGALEARFSRAEHLFDRATKQTSSTGLSRLEHWHNCEGLVSFVWQSWGAFCREATMLSMLGTTTTSSTLVATHPEATGSDRICYLVKCSFLGHPVKPHRVIVDYWKEVTWGDIAALAQFFSTYMPANHMELRAGLAYPTLAPGHLRTIRNASAHLSQGSMSDARSLQAYYRGSALRHPVDLIFLRSRSSGEIAFLDWMADLRFVAQRMCQ